VEKKTPSRTEKKGKRGLSILISFNPFDFKEKGLLGREGGKKRGKKKCRSVPSCS